jgi:MFS family permease
MTNEAGSDVNTEMAPVGNTDKAAFAPANSAKYYELKAVLLLSIGFGFVGIDRFMIVPLLPIMSRSLHLDYKDLGLVTGALSMGWGIAAILFGRVSDTVGRRRIVGFSMIFFSVLAGFSGLATGLLSLVGVRFIIGLADGAFTASSIAATLEASRPGREGLNLGVQQTALPLLGLGLAPILVAYLLTKVEWQWIFFLVSIPGVLIGIALLRNIRDGMDTDQTRSAGAKMRIAQWSKIFAHRNVTLSVINMLCWISVSTLFVSLFPSYLTDYLGMPATDIGFVLSAVGFGAAAGTITMPALSDFVGRKAVMLACSAVGALALAALMSIHGPALPLFLLVFLLFFCEFSLITLTVGPICSETLPPDSRSTASGTVIGIGEIFGGGIAPVLAGAFAIHFGIKFVFWPAIVALTIGFIASLFLDETAPNVLKNRRRKRPVSTPSCGNLAATHRTAPESSG